MRKGIINVPVADLRSEPKAALYTYEKDPMQESQLLFGEPVSISQTSGDWVKIEAIEQPRFREESGWTGYPGWVKQDQIVEVSEWPDNNLIVKSQWADIFQDNKMLYRVSLGTKLHGISQQGENWIVRLPDHRQALIAASAVGPIRPPKYPDIARHSILDLAFKCIGFPYLWGGRSAYTSEALTSVDCSGFVSLLYRVHGIQLPRDAQDQFLSAQPREIGLLKSADLIFLAPLDKPHRMGHVMLFGGGDAFFDANITDRRVVKSTAQQRFGIPFHEMVWGQKVGKYHVFFGSLLN